MPANAIWPSESWPPQPVRTVRDSAQIAKAEDRGVQQVPRRLGDDQRQGDGHGEWRQQDETVEVPHPEDLPQSLGDRVDPRREGEHLALGALPPLDGDDHQHHEEQHDVGDTRLVERVEPEDRLGEPDAQSGDEGRRERAEPTDQCRHERAEQRRRPERGEAAAELR